MACFDAAVSRLGLMFRPDPEQGLRELHRVLKPGLLDDLFRRAGFRDVATTSLDAPFVRRARRISSRS